jgi:mRNA degradation ribonuclease J1/J2
MGECTRNIYEARILGSRKAFDNNIEGQKVLTFRTGDRIKIGGVDIQPVHVDHSIPAAYGFLLYCSEVTIAYTGDFRRHGTAPHLTKDFVEAVQDNEYSKKPQQLFKDVKVSQLLIFLNPILTASARCKKLLKPMVGS